MDRYRIIIDPTAQPTQAIAFCAANGLDADRIPAHGGLRIYDDEIRYRENTGSIDWATNQPTMTEWRTVPLVSAPEGHGLAAVTVVPEEAIADRLTDALDQLQVGPVRLTARELAEQLAPTVQAIVADEVSAMSG